MKSSAKTLLFLIAGVALCQKAFADNPSQETLLTKPVAVTCGHVWDFSNKPLSGTVQIKMKNSITGDFDWASGKVLRTRPASSRFKAVFHDQNDQMVHTYVLGLKGYLVITSAMRYSDYACFSFGTDEKPISYMARMTYDRDLDTALSKMENELVTQPNITNAQ